MVDEKRKIGEPIVNAMTVDVEEHFQVSAFERHVSPSQWGERPSRVEANTRRLLELFDRAGVQATFFVLGWVAERRAALLREIVGLGHELGSHGYSHRLVYSQQPAEFRTELTRSKDALEQASGQAVTGHRAASFSVVRASLWALDIVAELGFTYDSSVFPVRHDRYGIPDAPTGIFRIRTAGGRQLVEFPPSTVRVGPFTLPAAGGGYLRLLPEAVTEWAIRRIHRSGRPAVVYTHPWEIDPDQPRVAGASWVSRLRHYTNLHTTAGKLAALMARHRFATMREVIDRADRAGELPLRSLE